MDNELAKLVKSIRCSRCDGSGGVFTPDDFTPCGECDGTGFSTYDSFNDVFGTIIDKY